MRLIVQQHACAHLMMSPRCWSVRGRSQNYQTEPLHGSKILVMSCHVLRFRHMQQMAVWLTKIIYRCMPHLCKVSCTADNILRVGVACFFRVSHAHTVHGSLDAWLCFVWIDRWAYQFHINLSGAMPILAFQDSCIYFVFIVLNKKLYHCRKGHKTVLLRYAWIVNAYNLSKVGFGILVGQRVLHIICSSERHGGYDY